MVKTKIIVILFIISIFLLAFTFYYTKSSTPFLKINMNSLSAKTASEMNKQALQDKELSIVAIGDSLTEGIGDTTGRGGYVYFLEQQLKSQPELRNVIVNNLGVKGRRTDQLIKQLKKEEMSDAVKDADIVIITIGGNDLMKITKEHFTNLTKELFSEKQVEFKANVKEIFSIINNYNSDAKIYLIGMYNPFSQWLAELNELDEIVGSWNDVALQTAVSFSRGYFIPIADLFIEETNRLLADDNFHPNEDAYELIADRIITLLGYSNFNKSREGEESIMVDEKHKSRKKVPMQENYMP